jgi:dTDP-4-amino-4,6-dideoxygalactose transaminase
MPSFTFLSLANAIVLRGASPLFVDIDPVTFNLDPDAVAWALTGGTRAVYAVEDVSERLAKLPGVRRWGCAGACARQG